MADAQLLRDIERQLNSTELRQNLTSLFCETLCWGSPQGHPIQLAVGAPVNRTLIAFPVAQLSGLPVFRVDWGSNSLPNVTQRRAVHRALARTHLEHLLCYVTSDGKQAAFVWARRRGDGRKVELRTLPYEVGSPARTTIERLGELAFSFDELGLSGEPTVTAVLDKLNNAFNVEAVTRSFFEGYKTVFANLQEHLYKANGDKVWAHDYALQFLNRLMFLYFIQRKRWLGNDPQFIRHFWEAYKGSGQPKDSFFGKWLSVLFFEAFNNKFQAGRSDRQHFPPEIREALALAPYLNGGLFTRNQLDERYHVTLPDDFFVMLFDRFNGSTPGFFERYNFTITESTPFDIEVAVDPEMIGKVYESLVNITFEGLTEEDLRGTAGIFYTPRVEIDLMCRLALVDWLANHLGEHRKPLLYEAVFAYELQEKEEADRKLTRENLWEELNRLLREVTVCDPACGSGSFLVGMLLVLDDLQERANRVLGIEETPYERRRRIIGQSLYGVDVMDWAVHVAELRLWLQLVVETELKPAELKFRPLLPNLSFKIRQGDSLVQEIGGINFGLHQKHLPLPPTIKGKITQLKGKKLRFYQGETQGLNEQALKREEVLLFREILQYRQHALQEEVKNLTCRIKAPDKQLSLTDMQRKEPEQLTRMLEALKHEREEKEAELVRITQALDALRTAADLPFVWDIAFVEIFEGDKGGFDIVLSNPPYVRQEKIAPPTLREQDYTPEQWRQLKAEYKAKLQNSVAAAYPHFFKERKLDGRSDLYIYFYLHGLSLLNPKGSFCFITSNSWLDVGYGKDLQEFLLKHSHVKMILDNEKKRTFAQADINTIIALLAPPDDRRMDGLSKTARFVMFKVPFEEVMSPIIFEEIEEATELLVRPEFRVYVLSHQALYEEGLAPEEEEQSQHRKRTLVATRTYEGNKWGGKYLRAPDIFFTILKKGKGKLVRLGDIAEVRRGITTGANEFFYLEPTGKSAPKGYLHVRNGAGWEGEIEEEFLKPVIRSPRECRSIIVKPEDLRYKIFMCHKDKRELRGTNALEYIKWGESQGFHERPTCRARQRWWDVGERRPSRVFWPYIMRERLFCSYGDGNIYVDCNLFDIYTSYDSFLSCAVCNATVTILLNELSCRTYGGGGGPLKNQVYEVEALPVLSPAVLTPQAASKLQTAFTRISKREILTIFDEIHQPDRRALDDVVFDVLGLTAGEREAVYEAVVELVKKRLEKAKSV